MSQAQGWRRLAALHNRIEDRIERALQTEHDLNVNEYRVLQLLAQQDDHHMRMQHLADAVALSQSATTRLVTRLEERGLLARYLCATDRRGIYADVTGAGLNILAEATPTHDAACAEALAEAGADAELAPLVEAIDALA